MNFKANMEKYFEIRLTYYPDENPRNQISINQMVSKEETETYKHDIRGTYFAEMMLKIDKAIK